MGELTGALVPEYKRCGKPNCRCARGHLHGPYYYRRWRDAAGVQRKQYVPRAGADAMRSALTEAREENPMVRLRELKKLLDELDDEAKAARQRMGEALGRYWHGRQLRERRSFPAEQRDRVVYKMNREQIVAALGWEITEDDFVMLQRVVRSERKRRNRLGLPWVTRDSETGQELLTLRLDLMQLPSYRERTGADRSERNEQASSEEEQYRDREAVSRTPGAAEERCA